MAILLNLIFEVLFPVTFVWLLISVAVSIARLFGKHDVAPVTKRTTWTPVVFPAIAFVLLAIVASLINIATASH